MIGREKIMNLIDREDFREVNQNLDCLLDSQWEVYVLVSTNQKACLHLSLTVLVGPDSITHHGYSLRVKICCQVEWGPPPGWTMTRCLWEPQTTCLHYLPRVVTYYDGMRLGRWSDRLLCWVWVTMGRGFVYLFSVQLWWINSMNNELIVLSFFIYECIVPWVVLFWNRIMSNWIMGNLINEWDFRSNHMSRMCNRKTL